MSLRTAVRRISVLTNGSATQAELRASTGDDRAVDPYCDMHTRRDNTAGLRSIPLFEHCCE